MLLSSRQIQSLFEKNQMALTGSQAKKLEEYTSLLLKWTKKINLIAPSTIQHLGKRHILDSAQLFKAFPRCFEVEKKIIDIGSGAGFPGLVLAALSEADFDLVDSDGRKCIFLSEVKRQLLLKNTVIHTSRIEAFLLGREQSYDIITARALAPLKELLVFGVGFLKPGGEGLFLKGRNAHREIEEAREDFDFKVTIKPSIIEAESYLVYITNLQLKA